MTGETPQSTTLKRIERDIRVEKQLRKQKKDRREDTTDVTARIDALRKAATAIRKGNT